MMISQTVWYATVLALAVSLLLGCSEQSTPQLQPQPNATSKTDGKVKAEERDKIIMREIDNDNDLRAWLSSGDEPSPAAVQDLDLTKYTEQIVKTRFRQSLFLGCTLEPTAAGHIVETGGTVIQDDTAFEFQLHRAELYTVSELFDGYAPSDPAGYERTLDYKIYKEYLAQGKEPKSIYVSLARRLHDHSITDSLMETIEGKRVVAVMGGHGMERQDEFYTKIAKVSRRLTQAGFLIISGGGPGAMEASHLGAFFAGRDEEELEAALAEIKVRPQGAEPQREYKDLDWLIRAWRIRDKYPIPDGLETNCMSIGIPTWLYGHEPPAPFATHIAKYFANSVREDGLLAIARHGVIFAPGSAGTTQEIFQDAAQNHYGTNGYYSPMILFGEQYWTTNRPVWPLLSKVARGHSYGELLALTDSEDEIIRRILAYDPEVYRRVD